MSTEPQATLPSKAAKPKSNPNAPTRQQGQFLAFISAYVKSNYQGVAPTHAKFQKFFNLTAPSVNSMLIRLEQRGYQTHTRSGPRY